MTDKHVKKISGRYNTIPVQNVRINDSECVKIIFDIKLLALPEALTDEQYILLLPLPPHQITFNVT